MSKDNHSYTTIPFPKIRRLMVDGGRLGRQKHLIHGLVEIDVTQARQIIHEHKARTGEVLSFTAFVMACLGRAVDMNKHMQAYRNWRDQLVIFDDGQVVDVVARPLAGGAVLAVAAGRAVRRCAGSRAHRSS